MFRGSTDAGPTERDARSSKTTTNSSEATHSTLATLLKQPPHLLHRSCRTNPAWQRAIRRSKNDLRKDGYSQEEKYFHERNRELIEAQHSTSHIPLRHEVDDSPISRPILRRDRAGSFVYSKKSSASAKEARTYFRGDSTWTSRSSDSEKWEAIWRGGSSGRPPCVVYDRAAEWREELKREGSSRDRASRKDRRPSIHPQSPRVVWLMLPAGDPRVDRSTRGRATSAGDILIDGGNSHYKDEFAGRGPRRGQRQIRYLDVGTSGGIWGLSADIVDDRRRRSGGHDTSALFSVRSRRGPRGVDSTEGRTADSSTADQGYLYCGPAGAGHFVENPSITESSTRSCKRTRKVRNSQKERLSARSPRNFRSLAPRKRHRRPGSRT